MPTTDFYLACEEKTAELRGTTLIKEGDPSNMIVIIISGDVEVVKSNLSNVFFNHNTGIVGIRESNKHGSLFKSDVQLVEPDTGITDGP